MLLVLSRDKGCYSAEMKQVALSSKTARKVGREERTNMVLLLLWRVQKTTSNAAGNENRGLADAVVSGWGQVGRKKGGVRSF